MKGPIKAIALAAAVLVLVGGAFWAGTAFQSAEAGSVTAGPGRGQMLAADGTAVPGGPMADLSEEELAELQAMTDEERQAWMEENVGDMPAGGMGGPVRGGTLEGEVIEVADDTLTISLESGSQTVYVDDETVYAYVEGAGELAVGSQVMVIAEPSADGVTNATLVVVM